MVAMCKKNLRNVAGHVARQAIKGATVALLLVSAAHAQPNAV